MSYFRSFRVSFSVVASLLLASLSVVALSGITLADEDREADPPRDESVVGGEAVPDGQYRFVAALIDETRTGNDYDRQFCGGTLIDADSILTAAHCVDGKSASSVEVVVGRTVLSSGQGVRRDVANVRVHPSFRGAEIDSRYDVAVLNLRNPVRGIATVRISGPADNALEDPGNVLTVAGWGSTMRQPPSGGLNASYTDRMRHARVPVVSDREARASYDRPSVPRQLRFYPALMVGAGRENRDSCQGDSGGPLFSRKGERVQLGITSYGAGCGARGYPGVYTEVNSPQIRSFILNVS